MSSPCIPPHSPWLPRSTPDTHAPDFPIFLRLVGQPYKEISNGPNHLRKYLAGVFFFLTEWAKQLTPPIKNGIKLRLHPYIQDRSTVVNPHGVCTRYVYCVDSNQAAGSTPCQCPSPRLLCDAISVFGKISPGMSVSTPWQLSAPNPQHWANRPLTMLIQIKPRDPLTWSGSRGLIWINMPYSL